MSAGANCARAQGGAWATNDNPYGFGEKATGWCTSGPTSGPIPTPLMRVNGSNENGWLLYALSHRRREHRHGRWSGAVRGRRHVAVQVLGQLATRAGGEAVSLD